MNWVNSRWRSSVLAFAIMLSVIAGSFGYVQLSHPTDAYALAPTQGERTGADVRAVVSDGTSKVVTVVYLKSERHTPTANTPVVTGTRCDLAGDLHYGQLDVVGTLSGTAPTLTVLWQNSKDGGKTWTSVGTWVTINATSITTPANSAQNQTVADIRAVTAVAYGKCWRFVYTMGGTNPGGTFSFIGFEK